MHSYLCSTQKNKEPKIIDIIWKDDTSTDRKVCNRDSISVLSESIVGLYKLKIKFILKLRLS